MVGSKRILSLAAKLLWLFSVSPLMAASPGPQTIPNYERYSSAHTDKETMVSETDFAAIARILRKTDGDWDKIRLLDMAYPICLPVGGLTTSSIMVSLHESGKRDLLRGMHYSFNQKDGFWICGSQTRSLNDMFFDGVTFEQGEAIIQKLKKNTKLMRSYKISRISSLAESTFPQDAPKGTQFVAEMRQGDLGGVGRRVYMRIRGRFVRVLSISEEYMFVI